MSDTGQKLPPDDEPYLWDRSGPADPDVARLEALLAPLAHRAPLAAAPAPVKRRSFVRPALAIGALALAASFSWIMLHRATPLPSPIVATTTAPAGTSLPSSCGGPAPGSWSFRAEGGPVRCGQAETATSGWTAVNEILETQDAKATLDVAKLGTVSLEPNTKLRVVAAENDVQMIDLLRGTMHATINAAPRRFVVRTPAALAVDLGCAYTLSVEDDGRGRLSVSYGAVSLERPDRAATLVTQGTSCPIGKNGPGTPLADGANAALRSAADQLDANDPAAFDRLVAATTAHDTVTLWHVMRRVSPEERGRAYDRLAKFVPPPPGAPRSAVVRGDHAAIAAYKEALLPQWFAAGPPDK